MNKSEKRYTYRRTPYITSLMNKYLYFTLIFPFTISACNLINPKEQVPTYLHLEPFIFNNPDSNFTGSSSHSIPSARISVDDQPVGTFDLPCTVPVIMTKTSRVSIVPQVTNQGLKSYIFSYPFYKIDDTIITYNPGKIQNYTPKTRYTTDLTASSFRLKINFEEGLLFKNLSGDTTILLEKDPAKVFEGINSGAIYLDQTHKNSESISVNYFEWPKNDCFLEFDYQSTLPFAIGVQAEDASGNVYGEYLAGFNPRPTWNKIYVNVTNFKKAHPTYTKLYLKVRGSLDDDNSKYAAGYILLDNLKVISK